MKKRLREKLLKKRDAIPPDQKASREAAIKKRLFALNAFKAANRLLMYVSFRSEVDTSRFLQDILDMGKTLVLPLVDPGHKVLKLYKVNYLSELRPGYMGIPEPGITENRMVTLKDIDLVVIPGTGFDLKGNRLGYGGGYYDKLLSCESRKSIKVEIQILTVALAFEEQVVEAIPAESHDIKVDIIVTDERLIHCKK